MLNSKELQDWIKHEKEDMEREKQDMDGVPAAAAAPGPGSQQAAGEPPADRPATTPVPPAPVIDTVPEPARYGSPESSTNIRRWLLIAALLLVGLIGYSLLPG